jgi:hypothetical protein
MLNHPCLLLIGNYKEKNYISEKIKALHRQKCSASQGREITSGNEKDGRAIE